MSAKTKNVYGKIVISDSTIERFISRTAVDCYGIVEFVPKNLMESCLNAVKMNSGVKGVKVHSVGDRIFINVSVVVKYGVSIKAVIETLKESLKYKVERFTGMIVDTINVNVMSVKL